MSVQREHQHLSDAIRGRLALYEQLLGMIVLVVVAVLIILILVAIGLIYLLRKVRGLERARCEMASEIFLCGLRSNRARSVSSRRGGRPPRRSISTPCFNKRRGTTSSDEAAMMMVMTSGGLENGTTRTTALSTTASQRNRMSIYTATLATLRLIVTSLTRLVSAVYKTTKRELLVRVSNERIITSAPAAAPAQFSPRDVINGPAVLAEETGPDGSDGHRGVVVAEASAVSPGVVQDQDSDWELYNSVVRPSPLLTAVPVPCKVVECERNMVAHELFNLCARISLVTHQKTAIRRFVNRKQARRALFPSDSDDASDIASNSS